MASALDANTHPQRLINANKRGRKADQHSDEAIKEAFDTYLRNLTICPPCGTGCGEGGCVKDLVEDDVRDGVCDWLICFCWMSKEQRYKTIVEWIKTAWATSPSEHRNVKYHFRYPIGEVSDETASKLSRRSRLCKAALVEMLQLGDKAWRTIIRQAALGKVVRPHGNKGRPNGRRFKADDPVLISLKEFMQNLEKQGEPRATRFVREEIGEMTLRDHDDKSVWLPMTHGVRACYRMYAYGQGWEVRC